MSRAASGTLPILKAAQAQASAPDRHVWLAASAGTGKTQVLAARVYRLLLRGVDPSAILCLTFTKAGAAEMAGRINGRLAAWVRMPKADLRKDLLALGEEAYDDALVARARTLFAKVLDAPGGGLRIQTIHGFCQSLLAAFPLEAGLVPGFRPLEAREEAILARDTLATLLVDAEREGRPAPVATLGALSIRLGEGGAEEFLRACTHAGEALNALASPIAPWLRGQLGLPDGPIEDHLTGACGDDAFDREALEAVAAMNRQWGTKGGVGRAEAIGLWLAGAAEARSAGLEALHQVWAKSDGDPRSFAKGQAPTDPRYADLATRLHGRCAELLSLRVRAAYADLLADALTVGRDYADAYSRAKRRTGAVDFDDLISATVRLLGEPGMGDWVRYKLDLSTDHILIDEAQDTNVRQWQIVGALAGEFFAGEGARASRTRTLFTVGDYKQAIFGFQGTDPLFFAAAEKHFEKLATAAPDDPADAGPEWTRLSLMQSFRSTRPILEFVDVAVDQIAAPGMGDAAPAERHASEVPGPGAVELWPPVILGGDPDDEESWVDDAIRELAKRIARRVRGWLDEGLILGSRGRALRPEDVMILVKRRGELASLLVARLHAEGVPVAGVDRLRLNGPLAVQDLLAAVRFALQPEDDLSLACLLVSPLIGWSQDDLMVAAPRERGSLWLHLRTTQPPERLAPLSAMLARVDLMTPYQFLEELLSGPLGGRRSLLRRLGREARDPIDELLAAALDFETKTAPSLQRFLDWFDRGEVEVVRDPSAPLDAVRVMTAHGAKGLQAPLVILADACVDPTLSPRSTLRWTPEDGALPVPVIRPRAGERGGPLDDVVTEADRRELEEHWRLFYVAATRAEERLVIAGSLGSRAKGIPPAQSWYATAARAMDTLGVGGEPAERLFVGTDPQPPVRATAKTRAERADPAPLPTWAGRPAPQEARPPRPLAPSSLGVDEVTDPPPGPAMRSAAERGRLLHGLFERLPDVPGPRRADAADRWLAGQGIADPAERAAIANDVLAIIDDPRFAALFGAGSLGEAPIAAVVADGVVVSGTVDRLLVTDERIRVVDFKTGRRAPTGLDEVPPYHLRQLAAYAAALGVIFPGRPVEAALLYTAGPVLIELPPEMLAAHKPGLPTTEQSLAAGG
ncbi:double-strand break repair helicase AddA [uncultured Sphingomonas sp.]|uniref:double-strand break repair helicase AddA n=1 Tax=uncultured Sphingomonas sp. TaxID=158754 RepID=UPI0035CAEA76